MRANPRIMRSVPDDLCAIAIEIVIDVRQTGGEPDSPWNRI